MDRQTHLNEMRECFNKMFAIAEAKNKDYCGDQENADPFKNFRLVENLGITTTEKGILVRICDKISRISSLLDSSEIHVKDESIEDTILDAANYLIIL